VVDKRAQARFRRKSFEGAEGDGAGDAVPAPGGRQDGDDADADESAGAADSEASRTVRIRGLDSVAGSQDSRFRHTIPAAYSSVSASRPL
jgi:hypothetical protein